MTCINATPSLRAARGAVREAAARLCPDEMEGHAAAASLRAGKGILWAVMIRSLFAVVVGVIIGLTTARFVEGAGLALAGGGQIGPQQTAALTLGYQVVLVAGWGAGAFAAAASALLIAGRWAPLGGLAAGTIFLAAVIAQFEAGLGWPVWLASALATALGGYAAIALLGATRAHPSSRRKDGLFDD